MKKPEPWQAVGLELMQQWRAGEAGSKPLSEGEFNARLVRAGGRPVRFGPSEFDLAAMAYLRGSRTEIIKYLRTRRLSLGEQEKLAWVIEEWHRPKLGKPKSLEQMGREGLAELALHFYRWWKDENASRGAKDWGRREEMKRQACELVVELYGGRCGAPDDAEAILQLTNRPVSRRK